MSFSMQKVRSGVFGVTVAGALGFGATQALASPAQPANIGCNATICSASCWAKGYQDGICLQTGCSCYIW